MCGIIAVVRRFSERAPAGPEWIESGLLDALGLIGDEASADLAAALHDGAARMEVVDAALRGTPGVRCLNGNPALTATVDDVVGRVEARLDQLEQEVDADASRLGGRDPEAFNAALVRLKDAAWAVRHDRLRTAGAVADLCGPDPGRAAIEAFSSVQVALSALDRLEVRGRDSAGLHLLVEGHAIDLDDPGMLARLAGRHDDALFTSMAVRTPAGHLSFVYKAAAEIGELGDNTRALRAAIAGDDLLHLALAGDTAQCTVLGHTRWASVGIISQANAHPLNQEEEEGGATRPYVTAALNGDVDNYVELRDKAGLMIPPEITTDAKVIPMFVARGLDAGQTAEEAFRQSVAQFDGSVAIAANAASEPGRLLLALRGSGQALYVGLADDAFIVASEPYGLVEETARYLRMDGEHESPTGVRGQVVVVDRDQAGTLAGIRRTAYDGVPLPVGDDEVVVASITTRDIDRGPFPHFLIKELSEAPQSFRKTLRGRIEEHGGRLRATLSADALPPSVGAAIASGDLHRVLVIGQGTAAIAGEAIAGFVGDALAHTTAVVRALPATELSGFGLDDDMSDTLVVAISQSGTTTDTNRTVDLVRARGASVISIVNRRSSDLAEKSDGVLYTSDGRDVEMSVPSTKAFYAQIAAGVLLAAALAEATGSASSATSELLESLRHLPEAMEAVAAQRPLIAEAAHRLAPARRHWAVVGNGPNRVAAQEVRIKLSELCYKSIACDATEDKKHIDLSAEPLILVCAAGLSGANADDVAKEVGIYRAHRAAPVVIANEGDTRFQAALAVIPVPAVHPSLAFVLSAMAGHLFGYEAALAIDAQARPFRLARAAIEAAVSRSADTDRLLDELGRELDPLVARFLDDLRAGSYDGSLEASTAVRVASLLRYATGVVPLDAYQVEYGRVGTPSVVVQELTDALTRAIEELTRPVDAIKHQAKTVTVGISRSEDALLETELTQQLLAAGAVRDRLSYRTLRTLAALDPAVAEVTGYTTYRIEGSVADGTATIHVLDQGGGVPASRTTRDPTLKGTKHRVAAEPEVTVARGRSDGRTIILVPETKDKQTTGLTVLHVRFHDRLPPPAAHKVLEGYRGRYAILKDAVTETEPAFDDSLLADIPMVDLLEQPLHLLADRWRRPVIGIGIDAVEIDRFRRVLARTPSVAQRLFTDGERAYGARFRDPAPRLAARFAAKEATMKALGVGLGAFAFHDVEVVRAPSGAPSLSITGAAATLAASLGVNGFRLSITHTDRTAEAVVAALP